MILKFEYLNIYEKAKIIAKIYVLRFVFLENGRIYDSGRHRIYEITTLFLDYSSPVLQSMILYL
jgi:hypothetical protein